ncbi:MAG TPA: SRPBCC family protein [Gemmata sp.]|jgi:ligand-binding SRPBCC domain-containing protein|nr:SRPBCC family protein [Gemmata sp.]
MTTIVVETRIAAPIELCFDLARDVDAHLKTSSSTGERAVGGRTSGLLDLGDTVTFEAVHFGIRQRLTSKIVEFDRPSRFVDEMVKGAFASLRHVHEFVVDGESVLMRDTLTWRSPLGFLGTVADKLFVERHMRAFMVEKQSKLKEYAERTMSDAGQSLSKPPT